MTEPNEKKGTNPMTTAQPVVQNSTRDALRSRYEVSQVKRHLRRLEKERGRFVGFDEAIEDWLANHAQAWRESQQSVFMERQREEMLRHKWIESEKAHRDLGMDAIFDWIRKYAAQWRDMYEHELDKRAEAEAE